MSAEERRESVVRAAMAEFARGGYHGTSTETIARRVGVSQPYLFRLFPGKRAIFLAAAEQEGDHEFGEAVRAGWMRLWDTVHLPLGADVGETTTFMAYGMLINCLVAMGFPADHRVWAGLAPPESGG